MKNLKPTRVWTAYETSLNTVVIGTEARVAKLKAELKVHEDFLSSAFICDHDWVGQDDEHPHGTPRETFICSICHTEEKR